MDSQGVFTMRNNDYAGSFLNKLQQWFGFLSCFYAFVRTDGKWGKTKSEDNALKRKILRHEPLEERRLLSVSQWDDVRFGDPVYREQGQERHDDDALLLFDEEMPGPMQTTTSGSSSGSNTSYTQTFVVNTLQDIVNPANGVMSLRKAIASANAVVTVKKQLPQIDIDFTTRTVWFFLEIAYNDTVHS